MASLSKQQMQVADGDAQGGRHGHRGQLWIVEGLLDALKILLVIQRAFDAEHLAVRVWL